LFIINWHTEEHNKYNRNEEELKNRELETEGIIIKFWEELPTSIFDTMLKSLQLIW
jgi:hypothetical protein